MYDFLTSNLHKVSWTLTLNLQHLQAKTHVSCTKNDKIPLLLSIHYSQCYLYYVGVGGFAGKLGMMVQNCCTYPPRDEIFSVSLLFFSSSSFLGLRVFSSGKRGNKERDLFFAYICRSCFLQYFKKEILITVTNYLPTIWF